MVEVLVSLLLVVAAGFLALWPRAVVGDRTIDGFFLTITGFAGGLILFNFAWQLRFQHDFATSQLLRWLRQERNCFDRFSQLEVLK